VVKIEDVIRPWKRLKVLTWGPLLQPTYQSPRVAVIPTAQLSTPSRSIAHFAVHTCIYKKSWGCLKNYMRSEERLSPRSICCSPDTVNVGLQSFRIGGVPLAHFVTSCQPPHASNRAEQLNQHSLSSYGPRPL
jgi:hypothetical protein